MSDEIVEKIYSILIKKRYNRDDPSMTDNLQQRLTDFVGDNKPIKLIGFWGVGPKQHKNWADDASCRFLNELNQEIKKIYAPGIEFKFIFAINHGIHNGYSPTVFLTYVKDVIRLFDKYSFKYIYLNDLWQEYDINFEKINQLWKKQPKGWWNNIKNRELIEKNASNRNIHLDPITGAQKYFIMRSLEKKILEKEFPDSIFHSFSDSRLRNVLPDLPTLYFYAREGWSDVPWFVVGE